jgi:hypothetical protein
MNTNGGALGLPTNLQQGLVAYYPFNGNANDESGNGNDGTVNGATLTEDRFGNVNSAYSFDGVDDFIISSSDLPFGNSNRTISVWINISDFVTDAGIVGWGDFNYYSYSAIGVSPQTGKLFFWSYGNDLTSNIAVNLQQWNHVLVTYDSQSNLAEIFINDFNVGSSNLQNLNTLLNDMLIGLLRGNENTKRGQELFKKIKDRYIYVK